MSEIKETPEAQDESVLTPQEYFAAVKERKHTIDERVGAKRRVFKDTGMVADRSKNPFRF